MIIKQLALVLGLGLATASLTPAVVSAATEGWTIRGVSQRAGPGPDYPRVGYVPGGAHVRIYGCIRGLRSCDISWRGNRGWVNGSALAGFYRGRQVPLVSFYVQIGVPFVSFDFGYWDRHYRNKPFFHQRDRWWAEKDWQKYVRGGDRREMKEWDSGKPAREGRPGWCSPNSADPRCAEDRVTQRWDPDNGRDKPDNGWDKPQARDWMAGDGPRRPKGQRPEWCTPNSDDEACAVRMQ
jgi:uncharacterized protein YraI